MRINSTHIRVITVLLAALATSVGFGQTSSADAPNSLPVSVEIVDQPGCPLLLTGLSTERSSPLGSPANGDIKIHPGSLIRLQVGNKEAKPIRGYVIVFDGGKTKTINTYVLAKFMEKGQMNPMPSSGSGEWSSVLISVDYVEFSDGTTWGTDSLKQSQRIERYFKGRELAIRRLNEIVTSYPDYEFFLRQVTVFAGAVNLIAPFPAPPELPKKEFEFGYGSVLRGLRAPTKRLAEGQEIARKLELLEQTPSPNER